jgi:hypothetical protein
MFDESAIDDALEEGRAAHPTARDSEPRAFDGRRGPPPGFRRRPSRVEQLARTAMHGLSSTPTGSKLRIYGPAIIVGGLGAGLIALGALSAYRWVQKEKLPTRIDVPTGAIIAGAVVLGCIAALVVRRMMAEPTSTSPQLSDDLAAD